MVPCASERAVYRSVLSLARRAVDTACSSESLDKVEDIVNKLCAHPASVQVSDICKLTVPKPVSAAGGAATAASASTAGSASSENRAVADGHLFTQSTDKTLYVGILLLVSV